MILPHPITLKLPNSNKETTFSELPVTIIDSEKLKRVQVQMRPFMKPLTLWEGESYTSAGNYTQEAVEARILELLGDDPTSVLLPLYVALPSINPNQNTLPNLPK